ncbi:MAG: transposase [Endozoicomonadaceae bacterium]|nr:transposase [Endozoicomonadaceae bacterium]
MVSSYTHEPLARNWLFRRLFDLSISESLLDHSTFWRFRHLLRKIGY